MVRAVLLSLLLVLALPLGVAGAPANDPATAPEDAPDIAVLTLNETERTGFVTTGVDVGTALAAQHEIGAARLDRYAFDERFQNTTDPEARQTLLFERATAIEIQIVGLRDDERALRTAYAARNLDTAGYVRELARIRLRVAEHRASLDRIQEHANEMPQFSVGRRVRLLDASLYGFEGPVRNKAMEAIRGEAPPSRFYVSVSRNGLVLSAVTEGRYVREAYRDDHRDREAIGGMGLNDAAERSETLYPEAYNTSTSIRTGIVGLPGGLYRLDLELRQGVITAYLDGATRNVFFEVQERRLDRLEERPVAVAADNDTRLTVNRTYPGGPLRIAVADNVTGEPRPTTVLVDGDRLETAPDGVLWTLGPGVPFDVTALGPAGNVTVSVRPLQPTELPTED